jgi:type IV pilus assembly protein PilX
VRRALRSVQQGAVLFIALIVLVAMSLAGIALMRSVDTGTIIAGNLAFRQTAMHVGDIGVEAARAWLRATDRTLLYNDTPGVTGGGGYYANWGEDLDILGNDPDTSKVDFNWSTAVPVTSPAPPSGYTVSYVIHRLCEGTGDPVSIQCVKQTTGSGSSSTGTKGAAAFGGYAIQVPTNALYRITVRVIGPRNNISYVQAVVY